MTTFLSFNENFNSKLTFTAEDSAETEEMLRKDLPLSHRWSVWEQIMPTSESKGIYADATQKVASFGTVQDFWRFWNHIPQPSKLLEQKRLVREHPDGLRVIDALMIFQENIRPEWEDKMNANGGHFQFQLKPSCGGGQIDEYWNNLVMGMIGATIDPPNMITGVRLVDKLSGPRASNVIRIEVWFTENEDSQAIGTLRKNVEKCSQPCHCAMPTLRTPRFPVTPLLLLLVDSKKVEYWQNCAARGLCDSLFHVREQDAVHKSPEGSPKGHWKPLGHPDFLESWDGEVDTFHDAPTPEMFWTKYHAHRRPFIVKGAVTESAAMNWTDQYIMDHFGDEVAKVEWRNEDRLTDYCGQQIRGKYIHCPQDTIPYVESRTSIRNFIQKSQKDPSWAKYIISQMPDAMGKDWKVPGFFNCGKRFEGDRMKGKPWMTQMYENNFWYLRVPPEKMGTSTIHYDMNHQVMCMFAGKKEWIMWDLRTESQKVPMWNEYYRAPSQGKPQGSDDSPIDGERVDLKRWPEFGSARWRNTTIEKGDCLYLPAHLLHYVRSWSDDPEDHRIIALMTMFQSEESYDPSYCKDVPSHSYLSDYDVMWGEFPGSMEVPRCMNHVKMGYPNWKRMLAKLAKKEVGEKAFVKFWAKEGYPKKRVKAAWQRFVSDVASETMTWAEKVFNSTALTNLAKDVACGMEGHEGPERKLREGESWDARNEYSLAGDYKGYTDEKHEEL